MQGLIRFISFSQILLICFLVDAQSPYVTGKLVEFGGNEPLPFANVQNLNQGILVVTDKEGGFKIAAQPEDTIQFSFIGYQQIQKLAASIASGQTLFIKPSSTVLQEVQVSAERSRSLEQFDKIRSGINSLGRDVVFDLPTLGGEPDFVKVITLLPGASKGVEGSNDFFIRGGAADQNLVLFDGATVYNTGHLFGFLSVFNPSTVGEVDMMTGGFPTEYGGRLSSIIDIRSKEIRKDEFFMEGGIGLISSRISAEIPIIKDKLAIQIAGRRTYADQLAKMVGSEIPYFFYDANVHVDYQPTESTRLSYAFYTGEDVLNYTGVRGRNDDPSGTSFIIGNNIQTLTLEKKFQKLTSQTDLSFTKFDYDIDNFFQDNRLQVVSGISEMGFKQRFTYPLTENDKFHVGFAGTQRTVNTNLVDVEGELAEVIPTSEGEKLDVFESALFGEWEFRKGRFQGIIGARISYAFLRNKTYWQPEPRMSFRYAFKDDLALKVSYTRMSQYIHRVSSSSFALPTDVWYPVDEQIRPQTANQWTLGINKVIVPKGLVLSMEGYYKQMKNLVEFKEGTNLVLNPELREDLLQGDGSSYGLEWLIRKDVGKLKGWISYTLSWTQRQFDELNNGNSFAARYDRRNNASVISNYQLSDRWTFSAVWEFISGARFTPIVGYYGVPNASATGIDLVPIYPERNSVKLADTHRLDLSIILRGKEKANRRWRGDWHFSIYNVYNRATPIAIDIIYDEAEQAYRYEQPGLLGLLPSVTYNFTFK